MSGGRVADDPVWTRPLASPVGELTIGAGTAGLRWVLWPGSAPTLAAGDAPAEVATVLDAACRQLDEWFAGHRTAFDLPLDPRGTPFQLRAWEELRQIPFGATVTYADQARRLGDVRLTRAVGAANGRNPLSIVVPCHRVVGADGSLVGFGGGLAAKAWLLDHERGQQRLL